MMTLHGRAPADSPGRSDKESSEEARLDSGRDGRKGRDRPEFSRGCGAGEKECLYPKFGFDGTGPQRLAFSALFPTITHKKPAQTVAASLSCCRGCKWQGS